MVLVVERCAICKMNEIGVSDSGVPMCLKCVETRTKRKPAATEQQVRSALLHEILEATALTNEAKQGV